MVEAWHSGNGADSKINSSPTIPGCFSAASVVEVNIMPDIKMIQYGDFTETFE
jgi:hypothetical protein